MLAAIWRRDIGERLRDVGSALGLDVLVLDCAFGGAVQRDCQVAGWGVGQGEGNAAKSREWRRAMTAVKVVMDCAFRKDDLLVGEIR